MGIPFGSLTTDKFLKKLLDCCFIDSLLLFTSACPLRYNHFLEILATITLNKSL